MSDTARCDIVTRVGQDEERDGVAQLVAAALEEVGMAGAGPPTG